MGLLNFKGFSLPSNLYVWFKINEKNNKVEELNFIYDNTLLDGSMKDVIPRKEFEGMGKNDNILNFLFENNLIEPKDAKYDYKKDTNIESKECEDFSYLFKNIKDEQKFIAYLEGKDNKRYAIEIRRYDHINTLEIEIKGLDSEENDLLIINFKENIEEQKQEMYEFIEYFRKLKIENNSNLRFYNVGKNEKGTELYKKNIEISNENMEKTIITMMKNVNECLYDSLHIEKLRWPNPNEDEEKEYFCCNDVVGVKYEFQIDGRGNIVRQDIIFLRFYNKLNDKLLCVLPVSIPEEYNKQIEKYLENYLCIGKIMNEAQRKKIINSFKNNIVFGNDFNSLINSPVKKWKH